MSTCASTYEHVFKFWFDEQKDIPNLMKLWFAGGPEQDSLIKEQFGELVIKARQGELSHWEDLSSGGPKAGLAFIILIDQFCRNIYRGTADMFSHDHRSLAVAMKIIDQGLYKDLTPMQRFFLYLPLEHHEDKDTQVRCVELFTELKKDTEGTEYAAIGEQGLNFSLQHKDVVDKFGRYPKRNAALGRKNTPEEEEFLKEAKYTF